MSVWTMSCQQVTACRPRGRVAELRCEPGQAFGFGGPRDGVYAPGRRGLASPSSSVRYSCTARPFSIRTLPSMTSRSASGVEGVFGPEHARRQGVQIVGGQHRNGGLGDDRTGIHSRP